MSKNFWMTLVILLGIGLSTPALAEGRGHDKDHDRDDHRVEHRDRDHDRDHVRAYRHDHDRDHHLRRTHADPPGWSHGKKKGWGGCDVPPGQAKKVGCHPYSHHEDHHHTTRPVSKPVVLQRPGAEVHAHAGVDAQAR